MEELTVRDLNKKLAVEDLPPSTKIRFVARGAYIEPKNVEVVARKAYRHGDDNCITIRISDEWMDAEVCQRMKEMAAAHVDAMFEKKVDNE